MMGNEEQGMKNDGECRTGNKEWDAHAGCRMNEKFKYCTRSSRVQYEEFRVHSTASKCVYLPSNHSRQSLTILILKLSALY